MTQEKPPPSPDMCTRPAPPLDLSMLKMEKKDNAQGSPFALLASGTPALRKVTQKPLFELFDDTVYHIRPPTQLMRLIDSLRYHKPTLDERKELNLCSSSERLYLHSLSDLLLACGGRKGFRFTSDDINKLMHHSEDISRHYDTLDQTFKCIPLEVTQYRFPAHVRRVEDEELLSNYSECEDDWSPEELVRWKAAHFQLLARSYLNSYSRLRDTCLDIRCRFRQYLEGSSIKSSIEILPEPVEAEFEAKANQPFPAFLHDLIQMYHREQRHSSSIWTPSCPEPPVDSIGTFSVYLAYVLLNQVPLTLEELHSFEILLQVLKLSYRVDRDRILLVDIAFPEIATHSTRLALRVTNGKLHPVTNTTLSNMLYEFLSTVRELRLVTKAKNLLPRPRRRSSSAGDRTKSVHLNTVK